jgi:hypothetical protein
LFIGINPGATTFWYEWRAMRYDMMGLIAPRLSLNVQVPEKVFKEPKRPPKKPLKRPPKRLLKRPKTV